MSRPITSLSHEVSWFCCVESWCRMEKLGEYQRRLPHRKERRENQLRLKGNREYNLLLLKLTFGRYFVEEQYFSENRSGRKEG